MPRDIPVGNGQMLVTFDQHYQVRDLYFPHVGQENHVAGGLCRFGVWGVFPGDHPDRRKRRLFWTDQGWHIKLNYLPETLASDVTLTHDELALELRCCDVVDFHRPVLVRRIEIHNLTDQHREVRLIHHQDFNLYGTRVGDTVYFDPQLRALVHYRQSRYLMACWYADGEQQIDEFATGTAGFRGAEGTWRDAEDGTLGNNTIAQGAVDSTMLLSVALPPAGKRTVYLILGCGFAYTDLEKLQRFLHRDGPQGVIDRTVAYWRLWLAAARTDLPEPAHSGLSQRIYDLYQRSLLVVRSQIDNSGAIIAANDSDIMQFSRDTYSYLWPRDGALVADALDAAGFTDVTRQFFSLCAKLLEPGGYFLHKYNPDGTPASSWHPWMALGRPQLPIQEDETALVVWALWRHYLRYRDIEFVRPLWVNLVIKAADFMVRFRDPLTHLPLPSYDLWEERWGVHAFTVASVYGALKAAWQFAVCFGDTKRATTYATAAEQTRVAFCQYLWSNEHDRFLRRIVPLDHERTARLMAHVMAGRTPHESARAPLQGNGNNPHPDDLSPRRPSRKPPAAGDLQFELDPVIDSAMYAIFALGLLNVNDQRVEKTMKAIEDRLWIKTKVGGLARYENDTYHQIAQDPRAVAGNPWFICTLWLAQWHIAKADHPDDLRKAVPILDWVANHALPSGVLAEQVHPYTNEPLSVSPLTWSHATVVATVSAYLDKLQQMNACPTCGQAQRPRYPSPPARTKLAPVSDPA
jgi:oligosaccharide amylase